MSHTIQKSEVLTPDMLIRVFEETRAAMGIVPEYAMDSVLSDLKMVSGDILCFGEAFDGMALKCYYRCMEIVIYFNL